MDFHILIKSINPTTCTIMSYATILKMERCARTRIPIEKIDGVSVNVFLKPSYKNTEVLCEIIPMNADNYIWLYQTSFTSQEQMEAFFKDTVPTLKYNKMANSFEASVLEKEIFNLALLCESDNVVLAMQPCCVCLDHTSNKTSCKHSLCLQCVAKMDGIKCPICRRYAFKYDSDSDEE